MRMPAQASRHFFVNSDVESTKDKVYFSSSILRVATFVPAVSRYR